MAPDNRISTVAGRALRHWPAMPHRVWVGSSHAALIAAGQGGQTPSGNREPAEQINLQDQQAARESVGCDQQRSVQ